ncbi:DUF805 domain-containing protein [Spirosoma soli]|uniref:DUF805 domain-containing protein n=1 Tax=Spirosoma soli TaxID=1770529 RepID=A0ABW5M2C4_9BACT
MNTATSSATGPATAFAPVNHYLTVLQKYADFKGRARRSEYWYFVLVNTIVSMALSFTVSLISPTVAAVVNGLYTLAILVPAVAVCVRRMHDVEKPWWYALIPVYNFILAISEGTKGANGYGADPKASSVSSTLEPVA